MHSYCVCADVTSKNQVLVGACFPAHTTSRLFTRACHRLQPVAIFPALAIGWTHGLTWSFECTGRDCICINSFQTTADWLLANRMFWRCIHITNRSKSISLFVFFSQYIRLYRIGPFGDSIHSALQVFLDDKDSGSLILTHVYLLLGLAVPLWLFPVDYSRPDATGEYWIARHKRQAKNSGGEMWNARNFKGGLLTPLQWPHHALLDERF